MSNEYDREKDLGVMRFKKVIEEIPGLNGHPFLYGQKNLLTIQLPNNITKIGWGSFYDCSNLYRVNVEDLTELKTLSFGPFERTAVKKLDFRNSKLTSFTEGGNDGQAVLTNIDSPAEYVLFPSSVTDVGMRLVSADASSWNYDRDKTRIKTLMIPTLTKTGNYYIENAILDNLIINKFDGIAALHYFNTDCIIWVPDEFYDEYVEYYTDNTDYENWQDIVSRLRKYSEGVPEFPMN